MLGAYHLSVFSPIWLSTSPECKVLLKRSIVGNSVGSLPEVKVDDIRYSPSVYMQSFSSSLFMKL